MPNIRVNGLEHYYEETGEGMPLVFLHGAFGDARLWDPQWIYFSPKYRLVRYDLRGHGRTGASDLTRYTIETFADDLNALLEALEIRSPVLCGMSWGGSIAQAFAVKYPDRPRALILASASVAIDLTAQEKILSHILVPRWLMLAIIRALSVEQFTRFSLRLGRRVYGKDFLSQDETLLAYLEECMLAIERREYLKLWDALYGFHLLPLERIACPTLVLNGEQEPRSVLRHSQEVLRRVRGSEAGLISGAHHGLNVEAPQAFNARVEAFLARLG